MEQKYMITDERKNVILDRVEHTVHRIKAIRDFGYIRSGDIGGWIECDINLSHDGLCWVDDNAVVVGTSMVLENARVTENATVYGDCKILGNSTIYGYSKVTWNAVVCGSSSIGGDAQIGINAYIRSKDDYVTISPLQMSNDVVHELGDSITFYRTEQNKIMVNSLYYNCSIDDYRYIILREYCEYVGDSEMTKIRNTYLTAIEFASNKFKI